MKIPEDIREAITQRLLTARAAAKRLGITEPYLCKLLREQGVKRIPSTTTPLRAEVAVLFKTRRAYRKQLAAQVKAHSMTIKQAAQAGNCSERTIYRYLDEI